MNGWAVSARICAPMPVCRGFLRDVQGLFTCDCCGRVRLELRAPTACGHALCEQCIGEQEARELQCPACGVKSTCVKSTCVKSTCVQASWLLREFAEVAKYKCDECGEWHTLRAVLDGDATCSAVDVALEQKFVVHDVWSLCSCVVCNKRNFCKGPEASKLACGHTAEDQCIAIATEDCVRCTPCQASFAADSATVRDLHLQRFLDELKVVCPHCGSCEYSVRDFPNHYAFCGVLICACGVRMSGAAFLKHHARLCPKATFHCITCGQSAAADYLDEHVCHQAPSVSQPLASDSLDVARAAAGPPPKRAPKTIEALERLLEASGTVHALPTGRFDLDATVPFSAWELPSVKHQWLTAVLNHLLVIMCSACEQASARCLRRSGAALAPALAPALALNESALAAQLEQLHTAAADKQLVREMACGIARVVMLVMPVLPLLCHCGLPNFDMSKLDVMYEPHQVLLPWLSAVSALVDEGASLPEAAALRAALRGE